MSEEEEEEERKKRGERERERSLRRLNYGRVELVNGNKKLKT